MAPFVAQRKLYTCELEGHDQSGTTVRQRRRRGGAMVEAAEAAYRRTYLASDRRLERVVRAAPCTTSVTVALPAVGRWTDANLSGLGFGVCMSLLVRRPH